MTRFLALLTAALLLGACPAPREEQAVLRLLDLAAAAESRWPLQRPRLLPREIKGLRTYRQLRIRKLGRVSMFPEDGGDSRLALVSPTGTRHRFRLQLPSDAMMRLGLGYVPPAEDEGTGVRFVVRIGPPGEEKEKERLVNQAITTRPEGGWQDLELDLSRWSGQEVELSLVTLGDGRDGGSSGASGGSGGTGGEDERQVWGAWSAPEILSREGSQSGPDVILISLDTLRADRLGSYGYPRSTSPNLDRLASRGIRFESAVSQAPWTHPSHNALFTGLFPTASAIDDAPRLAEVLRDAGYRTDALTGGGQMDFRLGFSQGFETYRLFDWIRNMPELEGWLERSSGRRRFLFLHTYEIHDPYIHTEFAESEKGGRAEGFFDRDKWWGLRGHLTADEKDYIGDLYDGGIAYTDGQLGVLFDVLDRSGALERSIVIVTSDHGEQFWEHGSWRHGMNLYDHQLLVPLIVHLPKSLKKSLASVRSLSGRVFEQQVRLIDLFPTVLDLLEIPLPQRVNGRSLKPLLLGDELPPVDAFAEKLNVENRESKALRTARYKFIYSYPKEKGRRQGMKETWELYDLTKDPGERTNVADQHPDRVSELDARLRTLFTLLGDASSTEASDQELDPDLEERLRALGYLGD